VGSHLTLWFHREDDARVRAALAAAFAGSDVPALEGLRARHERGRWVDATLDVRQRSGRGDARHVLVSVREAGAGSMTRDACDRMASRLRSVERRHRDLREMHAELVDAARAAATRENADLIEAAVSGPLRLLAEGLDAIESTPTGIDLPRLARLAQRIAQGLERTLATLRRAKQERASLALPSLAESLRVSLRRGLDGLGTHIEVALTEPDADERVEADPALLSAAFEHVAEHVAQDATPDGRVRAEIRSEPEQERLRIVIECARAHPRPSAPPSLPVDLELARGLLRSQGGDVLHDEGARFSARVELLLPLAAPGPSAPTG
jgi:hypothetical protein